jgi:hypothetical protein
MSCNNVCFLCPFSCKEVVKIDLDAKKSPSEQSFQENNDNYQLVIKEPIIDNFVVKQKFGRLVGRRQK